MAIYDPPLEDLPIFDTTLFTNPDEVVTIGYANKHYLKYPVAQGTEYLKDVYVTGDAYMQSTVTVNDELIVTDGTNTTSIKPTGISMTEKNDNVNYFIPFTPTGANTPLYKDTVTGPLSYNPSTSTVTATNFAGLASSASTVTLSNNATPTTPYYCVGTNLFGNNRLLLGSSATGPYFIPSTGYVTTQGRTYQQIKSGATWDNTVNCYYAIASKTSNLPNPNTVGVDAVTTWTTRTTPTVTPTNNQYTCICWSPELKLFVAGSVAGSTATTRIMTSPNGITWTLRTNPAMFIYGICWANTLGLFVAVGDSTSVIITSPDGIVWTARTPPAGITALLSVTWSYELNRLVAVTTTGTSTNRIAYSNDGITWTSANAVVTEPTAVVWCDSLALFVATSASGTNTSYYSSDGITWSTSTDQNFKTKSLCWSNELGIVACLSDNNDLVKYSKNGINWTVASLPVSAYGSICWSGELGLFVIVGTNLIYTSPNCINWTSRTPPTSDAWSAVCWSPELGIFCGVSQSGTNRAMTSSFKGRPPTSLTVFNSPYNSIDENGVWTINGGTNSVSSTDINTNATYYPTFVSGEGISSVNIDATTNPLSYNPSSGILTSSFFSGSLSLTNTLIPLTSFSGGVLTLTNPSPLNSIGTFSTIIPADITSMVLINFRVGGIYKLIITNSSGSSKTVSHTLGTNISASYTSGKIIDNGHYAVLDIIYSGTLWFVNFTEYFP